MPSTSSDKANSDEFDIRTEHLPQAIDEAALQSGNFPYEKKLKSNHYEQELRLLQIETVKMLDWLKKSGERVVGIFEGRDAAGKGSALKRLTDHMNPRIARVVALSKPSETERGQWYFQRYIAQLPTRGEMALFDRSWYNRAGVEPVFGFCTPEQTQTFLKETPEFESMLRRDGIFLIKYFLSIGREMQIKRLHERWNDPLARWKLTDIDFGAIKNWDAYSRAYREMLAKTHTPDAPWTIIRANDKKRTRLEVIRHFLSQLPYPGKDESLVAPIDKLIVMDGADFLNAGYEP